jgi:hypothetical protein
LKIKLLYLTFNKKLNWSLKSEQEI